MDTNAVVESALQAYKSVLNRPDLNTNGLPLATNGGTPSQPFQGFSAWPDWSQGNPKGKGRACIRQIPSPQPVVADTLESVAAPPAPPMPPLTIQGRAVVAGQNPTTGNVCIDLAKGYVAQMQLSQGMITKCATKGYYLMGSKPLDARIAMLAATKKLPAVPDQDVPEYSRSMGLAGADGSPFTLWASIGLGAAALWLGYEYSKGRR